MKDVMDKIFIDILRRHALTVTPTRLNILMLFYTKMDCLTHDDILHELGRKTDRVTVYRTLRVFVKKGILYCIPTVRNCRTYGLQDALPCPQLPYQHALFICEGCGKTYPMDASAVKLLELPQDFTVRQCDIILNGKCNNCH